VKDIKNFVKKLRTETSEKVKMPVPKIQVYFGGKHISLERLLKFCEKQF
jgi:hypothetical protein